MDFFRQIIDFVLHIDKHLIELTTEYGIYIYFILFGILFCETGLVVTAILPGDSLLFAAGALCSSGNLNIVNVLIFMIVGAILGNQLNFYIGRWLGPRLSQMKTKWINKEYIERTQRFYEKYGGIALIIGRFLPIIRTFVPLVAGIGRMHAGKFLSYNIIGAVLWIIPLTLLGYLFGNIPFVKNNFTIVILIIIVVSAMPLYIGIWNRKKLMKKVKEFE
ncbi:MAG: DedA family protein [Saprospiraceae bacterium]